ncbi:universal stress protein [Paractinoplanes durhamensis]|uniref:Universal stress protein n=1 Tax=Paractinoplanes durhamensis TaxID=113563 RepID=A0ABQ3YRS5_9ACTN|nr:universal stress protein [Actinoplanes durhamensis]GIE00232.1 universal stress protein [Actinoplanes durhamensis]
MTTKTVIVATDGTDTSLHAVAWAAREAERRAVPLRIVHAYDWDWRESRLDIGNDYIDIAREVAEGIVAQAGRRAHTVAPRITIQTDLLVGHAVPKLLEVSDGAELLVLGRRGRGGFAGLLLGSVSQRLAVHATCPVVVVHDESAPDSGPITAGVDDSPSAEDVLQIAFEMASTRGGPVEVVHSFLPPVPLWLQPSVNPRDVATPDFDAYERNRLEERLAPWRDKYPNVPAEVVMTHESIAAALVERSRHAQLVVVGSRDRGAVAGALLGSTGLQLLHHAYCPVLIARHAVRTGA